MSRFLELARAEAIKREQRSAVELRALAGGLCASFASDIRFTKIRFVLDPGEPVTVPANPERLESALRNVLHNAATFAGDGGLVRVRIVRAGDEEVSIEVHDSGPGIATEDLPRVFDRFFTTRPHTQGTGLGLALTRAIIEAHGGRVAAGASPDGGALFTLTLPLR